MQDQTKEQQVTAPSVVPLLLTVTETAHTMRWSRTRTTAAIAAREIESYKDGKRRFVVASSLQSYIAKRVTPMKAA